MTVNRYILSAVVCVMFLAPRGGAETVQTAAELIAQAHKHDNMYTLGPEASQQKALKLYESALATEPDEKQRLHILYRMAQLYGSSYDLTKGEKPNFRKAIELNKGIVESYPAEEPLVYKAISSICDHYTTVRELESALEWAKKSLEFDTAQISESQEAAAKIRRYQKIAVDQIAYTADHISYLRTHGELRHIADTYHGTFIAERANELLVENMDKMPDLWAPQNDFPLPENSTLQTHSPVPAAFNQIPKDIQVQSDESTEKEQQKGKVQTSTTEILQKEKMLAEEARAPPRSYLARHLVAAGLIILVLAAVIMRKNDDFILRNKTNENL